MRVFANLGAPLPPLPLTEAMTPISSEHSTIVLSKRDSRLLSLSQRDNTLSRIF